MGGNERGSLQVCPVLLTPAGIESLACSASSLSVPLAIAHVWNMMMACLGSLPLVKSRVAAPQAALGRVSTMLQCVIVNCIA